MAQTKEWLQELEDREWDLYSQRDVKDKILAHFNERAWEWYRKNIKGFVGFALGLFGLSGKLHRLFVEIFGPEPVA